MSDKEKKSHKNSKKTDKKSDKKVKKSEKSAKKNKALSSEQTPANAINSTNATNLKKTPPAKPIINSTKENSAKSANKKTFWPYGILLALFAIVCACVVTIIFASNYPVYEDDSFLEKYQEVDYNFNEFQQKDKAFKQRYKVSLNATPKFDAKRREFYEVKFGAKELIFIVNEIEEDRSASDIKPTLLLTRPHTSTQDSWLQAGKLVLSNKPFVINSRGQTSTGLKKSFNRYTFKAALPELSKGRWQIKLKATKDENIIGFYEFNLVVVD